MNCDFGYVLRVSNFAVVEGGSEGDSWTMLHEPVHQEHVDLTSGRKS